MTKDDLSFKLPTLYINKKEKERILNKVSGILPDEHLSTMKHDTLKKIVKTIRLITKPNFS